MYMFPHFLSHLRTRACVYTLTHIPTKQITNKQKSQALVQFRMAMNSFGLYNYRHGCYVLALTLLVLDACVFLVPFLWTLYPMLVWVVLFPFRGLYLFSIS